jgi:hypothetical protein
MNDFVVLSWGLVYMTVCVEKSVTRETIEQKANFSQPTGVSSPWRISEENFRGGEPNPCPCPKLGDRLHYLLNC